MQSTKKCSRHLKSEDDKKKKDEDDKKKKDEDDKKKKDVKKDEPEKKKPTSLAIKINKFNNHEHEPTKLVFRKETKMVYGKQSGDKVLPLTEEDIEECKKNKFKWEEPAKLSKDSDDEDDNDSDDEDKKPKGEEDSDDEDSDDEDGSDNDSD